MERWDFDCQTCFAPIGNFAYVRPEWYRCDGYATYEEHRRWSDKMPKGKHTIRGSGWGRHGYCMCLRCAIKSGFRCDVCGCKLIKVVADEHPAGHWGIIEYQQGKLSTRFAIITYVRLLPNLFERTLEGKLVMQDAPIPLREPAPMR